MTLKELAAEYRQSAVPLRKRLRDLRLALELAKTSEERWRIKRRIAELTPMLTQTNKVAHLLEHYYERGYWRDESISANAFTDRQSRSTKAKRTTAIHRDDRVDGGPAGYVSGVLCEGPYNSKNRRRKRSKQEHRMQNAEAGGKKGSSLRSLSVAQSGQDIDMIVDSFLHKKEK